MDTLEGASHEIIAAAADVDPSQHEEDDLAEQQENLYDDDDHRTRIMELAQQQQMTIQLLDEVVENQRHLQENLEENRLRRRRRQQRHDDDNEDGLEELQEQQQLLEEENEGQRPPENTNAAVPRRQQQQHPPNNNHHPMHHHHQHHREGGGNLFTVTQIYFIVSALVAFLAVVTTSPSNFGMMSSSATASAPPLLSKVQYSSSLDTTVESAGDLVGGSSSNNIHGGGGDVVDMSTAVKKIRGEVVKDDHENYHPSSTGQEGGGATATSGSTTEYFHPPSWHYKNNVKSSTNTEEQRTTPKKKEKKKIVSSSSSSSDDNAKVTTWEELLTEAFENIRDHYKDQYLILQNFWMYGTLTNLSSDPSSSSSSSTTMTTHHREEEDNDPSLSSWSLVSWTTWGRKTSSSVKKKKNEDSDNNLIAAVVSSQKKNGGISKSDNFSLYSIAMNVIHPTANDAALGEKGALSSGKRSGGVEKNKKSSAVSLAEKILTSTPRLIAIANLLLALVYLIHAAIADLFLGTSNNISQTRQQQEQQQQGSTTAAAAADEQTRRQQRRMGRERLGGYLLFKLLLISSVLDPGTDDLLILFSWYMVLSFLRSLTHLAGSTANRASQSGQPPRPGTLRLLIAVFICDVVAATGCIVLFHEAGWHLLLLLTCDCALVAADTIAHIVKYFGLTMEEGHRRRMTSSEEELATLRERSREQLLEQYRNELVSAESEYVNDADFNISVLPIRPEARLEREIQERELVHTRSMKIVDFAVFVFEMSALILTVAHFLHIWAWHGASFGLVDFVLALHLHSTISIIGKKIAERRSTYRIGAQLSSHFKDASDLDIRKASAAGDVCCICLNSMAVGNVKKVGCGHLFHTHCLREVVERERSIQVARCPLCRANLITGRQIIGGDSRTVGNNNIVNETGQEAQARPNAQTQNNPQLNPADTSLLRFSTEGWLPSWIPVPAFSFEVVRRETPVIVDRNPNPGGWQRFFRRGGQVEVNDDNDTDQAQPQLQEQQQQQEGEQEHTSFWRRLLILLGAIPMSPEEEAIAMEQLVDMFPQYERSDLLRELRARRSAEAVVESILLGVFSGVARGG